MSAFRVRMALGFLAAGVAGVLLSVTDAPLWAGIIALAVLCFAFLPWAMVARERARGGVSPSGKERP